jgi:hypothetical protein
MNKEKEPEIFEWLESYLVADKMLEAQLKQNPNASIVTKLTAARTQLDTLIDRYLDDMTDKINLS